MNGPLLRNIEVLSLSSGWHERITHVSHHVDLRGWEGCMFVVIGGSEWQNNASTNAAFSIQGCSSTTLTSFSTYIGSTKVLPMGGAVTTQVRGQRMAIIDLHKPLKPYARAQMKGFSSGMEIILGIKYGPKIPGSTAFINGRVDGTTDKIVGWSTICVSPAT